jgi:hypothetical protein
MNLTDRQKELLDSLFAQRDRWVAPMQVGGTNGSHHSQTLRSLNKLGLVDRRKACWGHGVRTNEPCRCKGSCRYRISDAGVQAARELGIIERHEQSQKHFDAMLARRKAARSTTSR